MAEPRETDRLKWTGPNECSVQAPASPALIQPGGAQDEDGASWAHPILGPITAGLPGVSSLSQWALTSAAIPSD